MAEILNQVQKLQENIFTLQELYDNDIVLIIHSKEEYLKFYRDIGYKFDDYFTEATWDAYINDDRLCWQYCGILCIGTEYDEETPEDSYMEFGSKGYYDSYKGIKYLDYDEVTIIN